MEISELPKNKKIILFDGICNLCNSSVQFVIKNDAKDIFRFVSLQSELGQKIIKYIGISDSNIDSIILFEPGIAYNYKSAAVFKIAKSLNGFLPFFSILNFLPTSFCNIIYDFIAKNRYKWYGKQEFCLIPSANLKSKFLD
jgi:predicted DCC family thiol-disulfide oxidoreductase YuxK